jgi:hypothetical protein
VISELHLGRPRYIELFNGGSSSVALAGLQLQWAADANVTGATTLPTRTLRPGEFVVLYDGSTPVDGGIALTNPLAWSEAIAVRLVSSVGAGIDFIRTGTSVVPPPAGTTFSGPNPENPSADRAQALVRNIGAADTDTAADWSLVNRGSPGAACASGDFCGDTCVDTNADVENCGVCGLTCDVGEICRSGVCLDGFGSVWLSEVRLLPPAGVEVHNPGATALDLSGFRLEVRGASNLNFFVPEGTTLAPGASLFFEEGVAVDDDITVFLGTTTALSSADVAISLFDDADVARDFVRLGSSSAAPPPGVSWFGNNVALALDDTFDRSAVRDRTRLDSDSAADWVIDGPSTPGFDCYGGLSLCGGLCQDLEVNPAHCGGCGVVCGPHETCSAGDCVGSNAVLISRVQDTANERFELRNGTSAFVNLAGFTVDWVADGGSGSFVIPTGVELAPGARLVLEETSGTSTTTTLFMNTTIEWSTFIAVSLKNAAGQGVDFLRTGVSATPPPAGTLWTGANIANPAAGSSLERDAWAADTDTAADWVAVTTPILAGVDCAGAAEVCGGVCEVTASDVEHCGACGERCSLESTCRAGACVNGPGDGDVRLVGGATSGRIEVFFNGNFHTVCDDGFDATDASVVCRQLGFSSGVFAGNSAGSGQIILDDLACTGSEARLIDCANRGLFSHNCDHSEDVAVTCTP